MAAHEQVKELLAAGRWADAAAAARDAGDYRLARDLYEKIWEFAEAARCAALMKDWPTALRNHLQARQHEEARAVLAEMRTQGPEQARQAAEIYEKCRMLPDAAALWADLGELERASQLYQRAGQPVLAARLLEKLGRDRDAGRMYERLLEDDPSSTSAPQARLALGRLLARVGQHRQAAHVLQEAARDLDVRRDALELLVVELAALGLRDAAADALARARQLDPSLPAEVEKLAAALAGSRVRPGNAEAETIVGGRYRLLRLLGAGGSGRVYLARDEVSGEDVAVKLFFAAQARGHEAYERFVREARISGRGRHPNIVDVLDFREDLGFLVMEYMSGGTLADRLKPRLTPALVRRTALDVLAGLSFAHARGIVHRDVKPANVFYDARGAAKLGDFGVAHLLDLGQTQTGGLIGTLAYMSPEQITGASITVAADLYALGVTMFLALTGRLPFLGPDFVAQHLGETPPRPSQVVPELGMAWDEPLLRLLEKDPAARFADANEVRGIVEAIDVERPRVLVLPRRTTQPPIAAGVAGAAGSSTPAVSSSSPADTSLSRIPAQQRYHSDAPLGTTSISTLLRAVDAALGRTVVVERFAEGHPDEATERRMYLLAASMNPHLQRVLAYDRNARSVVLEAPVGETVSTRLAAGPFAPRDVARMVRHLARALAPLHARGGAHAALTADRVLLEEGGSTTLVACGLGPAPADLRAAAPTDVMCALAVAATALTGAPASAADLPAALAPHVLEGDRDALSAPVATAEHLQRFADALEIALVRAARMRAHVASLVEHAWHLDEASRDAALVAIRARARAHGVPTQKIEEIVR